MDAEARIPNLEQNIDMVEEFLRWYQPIGVPPRRPPFIIWLFGPNGCGKTTAAGTIAEAAGALHVQGNSGRVILAEQDFDYGENVPHLVGPVINGMLSGDYPVVLDGMGSRRRVIEYIAEGHRAKMFAIAITANPKQTEEWARRRYADKAPSTFLDWRAKPNRFEGYIKDMYTQSDQLTEKLRGMRHGLEANSVYRLPNDGNREDLIRRSKAVWSQIQELLAA